MLLASCSLYRPGGGPGAGVMPDGSASVSSRFRSLAEAFVAWHYAVNPVVATADGVHDHDAMLGRFSREDVEGRMAALRSYLARLGEIDSTGLEKEEAVDYRVLENRMRSDLLELERVRRWERDPGWYREVVSEGLFVPAAVAFDAAAHRMAVTTARLLEVPGVFAQARENLDAPPAVYVRLAIEEFKGLRQFVHVGLPEAFKEVKDARFDQAIGAAVEAIDGFIKWLVEDLTPRANGPFALGEETWRAKLRYELMVDIPVKALLESGYAQLRKTQAEMEELSEGKSVRELLREAGRNHPPSGELLDSVRGLLESVMEWAGSVVDLPEGPPVLVRETPLFRRATSFASMRIPGPFEDVAKEAVYSVTLPDPAWPEERREQHLSFFNASSLPVLSVHETYPGHYVQMLALRACPSKVRKAFRSVSFIEGWAHYCEKLYVEEGDRPPGVVLQQKAMALLRICRYIVAIEMHARGMTLDQATELFMKEGYLERANAEREALRGTRDPLYLVYTLGKAQLNVLRDDWLARKGLPLREFHNQILRHGALPVPLMREILLGGEK